MHGSILKRGLRDKEPSRKVLSIRSLSRLKTDKTQQIISVLMKEAHHSMDHEHFDGSGGVGPRQWLEFIWESRKKEPVFGLRTAFWGLESP
jgi:hypothetical protein